MSELDEKNVSNNPFFRWISDRLDSLPGFKDSSFRAYIHGVYHEQVAYLKENHGNHEGADAERKRAQEQFNKAKNINTNEDQNNIK